MEGFRSGIPGAAINTYLILSIFAYILILMITRSSKPNAGAALISYRKGQSH
jgi:hypothetical protein